MFERVMNGISSIEHRGTIQKDRKEEISMKTKLIQLIMFSFMWFSLFTFVSIMVDFPSQLISSCDINAVYAIGPKPPRPRPRPRPPRPPGPPAPVPEPSTLMLLGAGLAAGGGIYAIRRYLNRNKKN